MNTKITVILPVKVPVAITPYDPKDYTACRQDFIAVAPSVLKVLDPQIKQCTVEVLDGDVDLHPSLFAVNSHTILFPSFHQFYRFEIEYQVNEKELSNLNDARVFDSDEIAGMCASVASDDVERLLLLASVAYPGRFWTGTGLTFVGEEPMNQIDAMTGLLIDHFSTQYTWPVITHMPLIEVCRWEAKVGLLENGFGDTAVRRALASYTHIQFDGRRSEYATLFFAMQGLESFYCRGIGDLRRQLSEKCRIFLGSWPADKNIMGSAYDLRSRFVHGDFPIMVHGFGGELDGANAKADRELGEATTLALRVLIATIHKCIREGITEVEYKWQITTT